MGFGQFAATTQFFLYGKRNFTRTGWERASAKYPKPDALDSATAAGKFYAVTGANSGVGKEVAQYLASKGGTVFMVCRSAGRAQAARDSIVETTKNEAVHVILADVSLEADVRRAIGEIAEFGGGRLDGLVCNAGALLNEKTLTTEGVETTFAAHLLFGTYLMTELAMPLLRKAEAPRVVVVSSGGMYNTAFPHWLTATSQTMDSEYNGNLAYAYAKRGQVMLCEEWTRAHPDCTFVSAHPGWTSTPAVDKAYGDSQQYLQPMRTPWEGAEGIAWLCVAPGKELTSGAFYLDREPQVKHIAGPFFTEGSHTKNTPEDYATLMHNLRRWACADTRPASLPPPACKQSELEPLAPMAAVVVSVDGDTAPLDMQRYMGRWYVIANIPTFLEKGTVDCTEDYQWDEAEQVVNVSFKYRKAGDTDCTKAPSEVLQRCNVVNAPTNTQWALSPKVAGFYMPVSIPYLVLDVAPDYSSCIVGVPDRSYLWIMARTPLIAEEALDTMIQTAHAQGYDCTQILRVPHPNAGSASGAAPEPEGGFDAKSFLAD